MTVTIEQKLTAAGVLFLNSIFGVLIAFNVVLTQTQLGAIDAAINAGLSFAVTVWAALHAAKVQGP